MATARWRWVMAAGTLLVATSARPATAQTPPGQPASNPSGGQGLSATSSPYSQVTPSWPPPKQFLQPGTATSPQIELVAPSQNATVETMSRKAALVLVAEEIQPPAIPEIPILPAPRSVAQPTAQIIPGNAAGMTQRGGTDEAAPQMSVSAPAGPSPGFLQRWKKHVKGGPQGTSEGARAAAGPTPDQAPSFWQRCKRNLQDCFLGFPEEFEAAPLGASVAANYQAHVANGDAARMVLYHYDFVDGTATLNLRGRDKLAEIAGMLSHNFFPIVIERTPACPPLAEVRRVEVLNELAHCPFPIPPERVVIGPPLANGLRGVEAEVIYQNLINQVQSGGIPFTGGAFGSSAVPGILPPVPGAGAAIAPPR